LPGRHIEQSAVNHFCTSSNLMVIWFWFILVSATWWIT